MAIFRRRAQPGTPAPAAKQEQKQEAPPVDPFLGDLEAQRFRGELAEGRWQGFDEFLTATTSSIVRNSYLQRLALSGGPQPWMDEWVAARPESGQPLQYRGRVKTNWAWAARGNGRASSVKEDAWDVFHQRLVAADRDLTQAAALDATDPLPLATGITVAMGLSLGQQEVRRRFEEACQREPLNLAACYAMIQATARKWGGSNEGMLEFARSVSARAPEGDTRHKLVALAHIECWLDKPKEDQPKYFQDEAVKTEIRAMASRCVLSPLYDGGLLDSGDRNIFAFCFYLIHDYEAQLEQMRLIGEHITRVPWQYQGAAGRMYVRARDRAIKATSTTEPAPGRPSL